MTASLTEEIFDFAVPVPTKALSDYDIDDDVDWAKSRLWTRGGSCQHVTIVCAGMFFNLLI